MAVVSSLRVFPAHAPPTPRQLLAACYGVDGSELVETFLYLRHESGKSAAEALRSPEFLFVFMQMIERVRAKAKGGAA